MVPWFHVLQTVHCDSDSPGRVSLTASALKSVRTALDVPERELRRWKRVFDANAKDFNGEKWVLWPLTTPSSSVNPFWMAHSFLAGF